MQLSCYLAKDSISYSFSKFPNYMYVASQFSCLNGRKSFLFQFERREKTLRLLANQLHRFLTSRMDRGNATLGLHSILTKTICCCCGRRLGNYLAILFIISKLLFIANVLAQLFVLNAVLRTDYNIFGFEVMNNVQMEDNWINSPIFPRVTMCDFRIRRLGQ